MLRNAFHARFAGDRSAPRRRAQSTTARHRVGGSDTRGGRTHPAERADAEQQPGGAEPVPQADGHP
jgi:hypothetical protein